MAAANPVAVGQVVLLALGKAHATRLTHMAVQVPNTLRREGEEAFLNAGIMPGGVAWLPFFPVGPLPS